MSSKKLIIFTDIGDTIIDEGTEKYDLMHRIVQSADCIPGAKEATLELYSRGYTYVMVADGAVKSFHNTMTQHGLEHVFAEKVISEQLGTHKPDVRMFQEAFDRMGLKEEDKKRVIMVGNNVIRDINGANRFGITPVLIDWAPETRRSYVPHNDDEIPKYTIHTPAELIPLVEKLEAELEAEA